MLPEENSVEERTANDSDLEPPTDILISDAIEQAILDEVDVVNLSAGVWHKICGPGKLCPFHGSVTDAVDAGITIVASIGNACDRRLDHVWCPAMNYKTISVGGITRRCGYELSSNEQDYRIWADTYDMVEIDSDFQGRFCSTSGCTDTVTCGEDSLNVWWGGNTEPVYGNPDVLAPPEYPEIFGKQGCFSEGTSFSAPLVTGIIARLIERVPESKTVDPEMVCSVLRTSGDIFTDPQRGEWVRVNAAEAIDQFLDHPSITK